MDDNKVLIAAEFYSIPNDVHELTVTDGELLLPKKVPVINNKVKTINAREDTLYTCGRHCAVSGWSRHS